MLLTRRSALGALTAVSMAALTACGRDAGPASGVAGSGGLRGAIKGAGASSQADAQAVWMNAFMDANPHAVVDYAGGGSGAGRFSICCLIKALISCALIAKIHTTFYFNFSFTTCN